MRTAALVVLGLLLACNAVLAKAYSGKVVCYFNNWAIYRPNNGNIDVSDIDASLCTHLIYNVAGITDDANLRVTDPNGDLPMGRDGYRRFNQLRLKNPKLQTLIAVGGYNEGTARFSRIAANAQLRRKFVDNAVAFLQTYGFNGMDLQWSYPTYNDRQNYVQLLKQLKERFVEEGLILSAMVMGVQGQTASYDVPQVVKYLDFVNVIAFDLHGSWDRMTGIHTPLYPASWESGWSRQLNVDTIVKKWLSLGTPAKKLVLSIATYGRTFTLDSSLNKGIGAMASQPGYPGPYTRVAGQLGFNEICEEIKHKPWEKHYENEQRVPYMVLNDQWVGYDDVRSVNEKVAYVRQHELGGAFVYTLDTDDFRGICGTKYPILKAVNALR